MAAGALPGACATLPAVVRRVAARRGDAVAFAFQTRETSFARLETDTTAIARALLADGARPGERVGYLGKSSDRYFALLIGAAKAALVMTPIGWRLTSREVDALLADAEIGLLFIEPQFHALAAPFAQRGRFRIVSTEGPVGDVPAFEEWRARGAARDIELPPISAADPVLQIYTSGTTGMPKGVVLSHANLFVLRPLSAAARLPWDTWGDEDVALCMMPVAHVSGSLWGLLAVYHGIKAVVLPEFEPGAVLRAIATQSVSKMFLVPAAIRALLRHPDIAQTDFSRLRYLLYGAAPIPLDLLREALAVIGCGFIQNYGMTETGGTATALAPEDHDPAGSARMRSAGRAMPGVEVRVVDQALQSVPTGVTGEITIRSPAAMIGYWKQPQATAEILIDGWVRTGDAGYLDADGYLFVQDRLKDMIISGGENVYPAEVEDVLHGHPDVADVAVIAVPDEQWGEAVVALVAPKPGTSPDPAAIKEWARERLASYKSPKQVLFRDSLPRNASGKILRRLLREPFWEGRERKVN
jgi:long-chain acyl-CoA synthetase